MSNERTCSKFKGPRLDARGTKGKPSQHHGGRKSREQCLAVVGNTGILYTVSGEKTKSRGRLFYMILYDFSLLTIHNFYDVSCKELDFLVEYVKNIPEVAGARMMGGGFGGCTINLVKENAIDKLVKDISAAYEEAVNLPLTAYIASIENGTGSCT